jgi:hypothetical protein
MKNIHVLPTDKPSRLLINWEKDLCYKSKPYLMEGTQNIYITSDEEIKEGDWFIDGNNSIGQSYRLSHVQFANPKKIILTTDFDKQPRIQAIDDEFLEWFVKNPSCEEVKVLKYKSNNMHKMNLGYKIIIPKEEPKNICIQTGLPCGVQCLSEETCNMIKPKQETLEEVAERLYGLADKYSKNRIGFIEGAKWQQQNSYSEEEVLEIIFQKRMPYMTDTEIIEWFEQFKKK